MSEFSRPPRGVLEQCVFAKDYYFCLACVELEAVGFHPSGDFGHAGGEIGLGVRHLVREGEYELGVVSIGYDVDAVGNR